MPCSICESPLRKIWPPVSPYPELDDVDSCNWMSLSECKLCKTLWACVPYEPYASFKYSVVWGKSKAEWSREIRLNKGKNLHDWHNSQLLIYKDSLNQEDIIAIEKHRIRSSGHDPYTLSEKTH